MEDLKEQFPDMTQSVIGDILSTYSNNVENAAAALTFIRESSNEDQEKKIVEVEQMFPSLTREVIRKALRDSGWNVEDAILPLFAKVEELKKAEQQMIRMKKAEEEKKKKQKEAEAKVFYLMEMFAAIPKEKVQKILEENEGDIEETTAQLSEMLAKIEENKEAEEKKKKEKIAELKKKQEEESKMIKIQVLREKFRDLSETEILDGLNSTKWDIRAASSHLLVMTREKSKQLLKGFFKTLSDRELESALDQANWDVRQATQNLFSAQAIVAKPQPTLMEKSLILEEEVERELTTSTLHLLNQEKKQKEEINTAFMETLGKIIATQARGGEVPGIHPPLSPKQIDVRLEKEKPVKDELLSEIKEEVKPEPVKVILEEEKPKAASTGAICVVLSVNNSIVDSGNEIRVDWKITEGTTSSWDWIGLFPVDKQNKEYLTYQYRGKGETEGTLSFVAPKVYGEYEFRYFPSGSYVHLSRSSKFVVGPQFDLVASLDETKKTIQVTWSQKSGNSYSSAWIGLYPKTQTNNSLYLTWEYAGKTGNVSFAAPIKPGDYELRLFPYSYIHTARSNVVTIEGSDVLNASISPEGDLIVQTDIVTIDPYRESAWLGVYLSAENDNRCWRKYKNISQRKEPVQFKLPRVHGDYEVRLFANKTYDVVARSNVFKVLP